MLAPDEPDACVLVNAAARAPILLVCDHASRRIPRALGDLGLDEAERSRHIAWDIGAADVTHHLAARLGAPAVLANYSRLVIDCNRHPHDPTLIPESSDGTVVAGNRGLGAADRNVRIDLIHRPYHRAIADLLDRMATRGSTPAVLSIHSCTPQLRNGPQRPWHIGICWEHDRRLAAPVLAALRARTDLVVGDNEPYALTSDEDYTLPVHAARRGLAHLLVEFRQDLVDTPAGAVRHGDILLEALRPALAQFGG
jgi:predicted N-formylglutamate amidohydrolase